MALPVTLRAVFLFGAVALVLSGCGQHGNPAAIHSARSHKTDSQFQKSASPKLVRHVSVCLSGQETDFTRWDLPQDISLKADVWRPMGPWRECLQYQPGSLHIRWNFPQGAQVQAYPHLSVSSQINVAIASDAHLYTQATVDDRCTSECHYDIGYDIWMTRTPGGRLRTPDGAELMVLWKYDLPNPGPQHFVKKVTLDGTRWSVYLLHPEGWPLVQYIPDQPIDSTAMNLMDFVQDAKHSGLLKGIRTVGEVDFGAELAGGKGRIGIYRWGFRQSPLSAS